LPRSIQVPKWHSQSDAASLAADLEYWGLHLWIIFDRDFESPALLQQGIFELTAEELARAERFSQRQDCHHFIVGRWMLRQLLGSYSFTLPRNIEFAIDEHGRPSLANPAFPIDFNLSHTAGIITCAFALRGKVGIDVEKVRPDRFDPNMARNYFSEVSCRDILDAPPNCREQRFFEHWVLTEAYAKARGDGLTLPAPLSFSFEGGDRGAIRVVCSEEISSNGWQFYLLRPGAEHRMAIATARGSIRAPIVRALRPDGSYRMVLDTVASYGSL
jgi:4'-phosphopantetheinyl transferase